MQWGSKYRYSFGQKEVRCQWSGFLMPFVYRSAQPFEYQTNGSHLVVAYNCLFSLHQQTTLLSFSSVLVWYSDIPNHLRSELQKVWFSNGQNSDPHYNISKKLFQLQSSTHTAGGSVLGSPSINRGRANGINGRHPDPSYATYYQYHQNPNGTPAHGPRPSVVAGDSLQVSIYRKFEETESLLDQVMEHS